MGQYSSRQRIGSARLYSTYLGGGSLDVGHGIAVDVAGSAYVTGYTASTDFPTTAGAVQTTYAGNFDAFVTKLNPTGSGRLYSTYLGGSSNDIGQGIVVDGAGSAYVTGYTLSTNFPTTSGAVQTTHVVGGYDAFVTKLDATGSARLYSTYLGGNQSDIGHGIGVDGASSAYVTGYTASTNFPTTAGAVQTTLRRRRYRHFCYEAERDRIGPALFDLPGRSGRRQQRCARRNSQLSNHFQSGSARH